MLDDEFGEIAVLTIDFAEIVNKRKFFTGWNDNAIVLLNGTVNIENTIFGRATEIGFPLGNFGMEAKLGNGIA